MEAKMPTKQQLEQQNAELLATNEQLLNQIPERIGELIERSDAFASAINIINSKTTEISNEGNTQFSKLNTEAEEHIKKLEELQSSIINDGKINMQNVVDRVEQLKTYENRLTEKYEDYFKSLPNRCEEFFASYERRQAEVAEKVSDGITEAKEEIAEEIRKFRNLKEDLKEEFHSLAKDGFNSSGSSLITQAYEKMQTAIRQKKLCFK
jgi:archaellum component FlaC